MKLRREFFIVCIFLVLCLIGGVFYILIFASFWEVESSYKILYTISVPNNEPIEIRVDSSALSMDAIVVRQGDKTLKVYNKHTYFVDKILIRNDKVNIYIKGNGSSTRNDTIILAIRQE